MTSSYFLMIPPFLGTLTRFHEINCRNIVEETEIIDEGLDSLTFEVLLGSKILGSSKISIAQLARKIWPNSFSFSLPPTHPPW